MWSVQPVDSSRCMYLSCVYIPVLFVYIVYTHPCVFVYLVFPYEGPQLPAVSPSLSSVVEVTGFRDAPPHGGTVVLKLDITWRVEA